MLNSIRRQLDYIYLYYVPWKAPKLVFVPQELKGKVDPKNKLIWDERAKEKDMNTIDCL